jgi:hypothetical protein
MRSHFVTASRVATACAVAGAAAAMNGNCAAGTLIAADYATNATYLSGWSTNQNGGYGFGAWSFSGTSDPSDNSDPGGQQTMSSASPIGTAWTLFNLPQGTNSGSGISNVGRAITEPGGLQPGQTFETIINNPTAYHYYGGFDILFYNGADNLPAGNNNSALRTFVFNYFVTTWRTVDNSGTTPSPLTAATTAAAGMKVDFTLLSTNTYSLTLTPLSNPSAAFSHSGTLRTNLPINWVNYRLWNGPSSGPNDVANNFGISSMTIAGLTLNIQVVGPNAVLSWPTNSFGLQLASTLNLGTGVVWSTNFPPPVVVNGQNIITNPITGAQQYYRLQQ